MFGKIACLIFSLALFTLLYSSASMAEEEYVFVDKWPDEVLGFRNPCGIAVDNLGNVYVVDRAIHRIQKFSSDGTYLTQWGSYGYGNGQLRKPEDVAVDSSGNVYVVDKFYMIDVADHRVQKFDSNGKYLTQWNDGGLGYERFDIGTCIAVDSFENVYMVDNLGQILKFTSNGEYLASLENECPESMYNYPLDMVVDNSGNVYVVGSNCQIHKFTQEGDCLAYWGTYGSGNGQFIYPASIALDNLGNVYVADTGNHRIQKFTSDGTYLDQWGTGGSESGQFHQPESIAIDDFGNVYVADTGNRRVQKFTSDGTYLTQWGTESFGNGQFCLPKGIAVDDFGNVYVADNNNHRVQKFDNSGKYLAQWGSRGSGDSQFSFPEGIAVDSFGNVYVVDTGNHRVQKFDSNGTYLTQWGYGQFNNPKGIAVDSSGSVYVADSGNCLVQKFDSNGTYLTQWGGYGYYQPGLFLYPEGIATSRFGSVYVVDTYNHWIQKFTSDGKLLTGIGDSYRLLYYPEDIAVDSSGNLYRIYSYGIIKYTANCEYLTRFGTFGSGDGQFLDPDGIAVDNFGNIYVADTGNHRVQVIRPNQLLVTWDIPLNTGWNLISFPANKCFYQGTAPAQPNCVEKVDVINTLKFNSLSNWFSSVMTPNNAWRMVIGSEGAMDRTLDPMFHSLKYMSPCSGYWVKIDEGFNNVVLSMEVSPFDPSCPIPLKTGWNLVGFPISKGYYDTNTAPTDKHVPEDTEWTPVNIPVAGQVFSSIMNDCEFIIGEEGAYNPALAPGFSSLRFVAPGYGYWVKMKKDGNLIYSEQ